MTSNSRIFPVILSGGSGTRLWPLSRASLPKQLLSLHGPRTMIQETVLRAALPGSAAPFLLCNDNHRFFVAEQMQTIGVKPGAIVLEPIGRNTAPAAAVAALMTAEADPRGIVLLLPSDHVVSDPVAFSAAVAEAVKSAMAGFIVTFGITPTAPETGFGYIQRTDEAAGTQGAFKVKRFVEKPDAETATGYLAAGNYSWNSGMFVFRADVMLAELDRHAPEVLPQVRLALEKAQRDLDFVRLDAASFAAVPNISIDYAVMEHTDKAAVVPCSIGWNDVGSWSSLWEIQPHDESGNVFVGDVFASDTTNSFVRSDKRMTALVGVDNLVVVNTKDAVLVADKSKAQDVKAIMDQLKAAGRTEAVEHTAIFRPWGSHETIDTGDRFLVNHLTIKPGGRMSLHMHHHRAEHWVVVEGTARITCGDKVSILHENQSTYIPLGEKHRLENPGKVPLCVIEVQSGPYLGGDDIVRFDAGCLKPAEPTSDVT
ncbi:MAG: mannose-1-phosphate guanylyltransferase/mannose-6-phosphate isomerase [Rhizomicrobium sp.]